MSRTRSSSVADLARQRLVAVPDQRPQTPSLAAAASDSSACHWRSSPNISSRDPPAHRHPGPDVASRTAASAADSGHASHFSPLAKPER
jgi:hypothetical protein